MFALIAVVGIGYFIVVVSMLHFLRPDYNPVNHAVSNYAVGQFGYLMTSAFYVLALSVLSLAIGLVACFAHTNILRVAITLMCSSSCGMVVMGVFPGDAHALHPPATITGVIHWAAAAFAFLCIMITAFLIASSFESDERYKKFQRPCFVLSMTMVAALLLYGVLAMVGWIGIGQRIYLTVCLLWLILLAKWIWTTSRKQELG